MPFKISPCMLLFNKIQINFLEADSVSWISAGFPLTALNVFVAFCKKFGCIINPSVYGSLALFQRFFLSTLNPARPLIHHSMGLALL